MGPTERRAQKFGKHDLQEWADSTGMSEIAKRLTIFKGCSLRLQQRAEDVMGLKRNRPGSGYVQRHRFAVVRSGKHCRVAWGGWCYPPPNAEESWVDEHLSGLACVPLSGG